MASSNILPKVLVFTGQPFNYSTGLGITLGNLFKGWPKELLSAIYHEPYSPDTRICKSYYRLEEKDQQWLFPINIMWHYRNKKHENRKAMKDNVNAESGIHRDNLLLSRERSAIAGKVVRHILFFRRFRLTIALRKWICDYNPDVLYCCVVSLAEINFALTIAKEYKVRLVIHMLDDWPSLARIEHGYLMRMWSYLINMRLRLLFCRSDLLLGICDEMCNMYTQRYGKLFLPFHNCPDPDIWVANGRGKWDWDGIFSFVFTGAVYNDFNAQSLREIVSAICKLNSRNVIKCSLTIYSDSENALKLRQYANGSQSVQVKKIEKCDESIAKIYGLADGLLMPFDFNDRSVTASRLSFPTKMPTYMLSSTPIFAYGPLSCATIGFLRDNAAAYVVDHQCDIEALADEIESFCCSSESRRNIAGRAREIAEEKMVAGVVRNRFEIALSSLVHQ